MGHPARRSAPSSTAPSRKAAVAAATPNRTAPVAAGAAKPKARKRRGPAAPGLSLDLKNHGDIAIEIWALDRLKPYARNSRTHSKDQIARIAKSIEEFGFTNPILVAEDGTIIAGHGRSMAAALLKMTTVPVIVASGWTATQRKAYVIADNKIALDAGWDEELLKLELGELAETDFDLDLTGFNEDALDKLFGRIAQDVVDTSPQLSGLSYSVVVRCTSEEHQTEMLERFEGEGLKCEALIS